ncbi:indole-3-glycerol phosphate synthase TrpC [Egicoccus halophilus]|uniref:Indole-3-glycerol phosphate synthase n=1 Tax=Egicoccus halophilus TaxID=1670830 RepID=A0A8J3A8R2_9ACTN|nr:indole-3-glycerol phosphate synthase TrpC [Egicoccus halophilus]GGI04397.1 indole-3-glycerol phosphate synthase 1 [Egicoccus halophilus]
MATYLDDLLLGARRRVEAAVAREPLAALRERAVDAPVGPAFAAALAGAGVSVIAEVKRASPSKGPIAPDLNAPTQAAAYVEGGAAAVSVLTEPDRFGGSLADLADVAALGVPALRKDFLVDPYQVWEARAAGAGAVLLIAAALDEPTLARLHDEARSAGLDVLVEIHDEAEAAAAGRIGAELVGVNARDLRTFVLDRDGFARLRPHLPERALAVAESGVRDADDVRRAAAEGADAVLVGEALVRAADPRATVAALLAAGGDATAGPATAPAVDHRPTGSEAR